MRSPSGDRRERRLTDGSSSVERTWVQPAKTRAPHWGATTRRARQSSVRGTARPRSSQDTQAIVTCTAANSELADHQRSRASQSADEEWVGTDAVPTIAAAYVTRALEQTRKTAVRMGSQDERAIPSASDDPPVPDA